ncbi:MAG: cbb3-type cytochrome c oxidase subunit I [Gammaproteobacteria bacterium]
MSKPESHDRTYRRYILWFIYACIVYSIIGFSWGAIVGMIPDLRDFINNRPHAHLIMLGHGHINLLGWVEMAIFASLYYVFPRVVDRPIYSLRLVKIHFWTHNIGLLGMVASFVAAGTVGGLAGMDMTADEVNSTVRPFMISVGMFGLLVLTANGIWAYNLFRTGRGWGNEHG